MSTEKIAGTYLLCRPLGGLNDILCQVGKSIKYAKKTKRDLILDLRYNDRFPFDVNVLFRGPHLFQGEGGEYPSRAVSSIQSSTYPEAVSNKVEPRSYEIREYRGWLVDKESSTYLTWSHQDLRSWRLVLHEQWGGGLDSLIAFAWLQPSNELKNSVRDLLKGHDFSKSNGIHYRNSDYRSSFELLFSSLERHPQDSLIFTDDISLRATKLPLSPNWDTANYSVEAEASFVSTLCDLIALASCKRIELIRLDAERVQYSGFGILAASLWCARATSFACWVKRCLYVGGHFLRDFKSTMYFVVKGIPRLFLAFRSAKRGLGLFQLFHAD